MVRIISSAILFLLLAFNISSAQNLILTGTVEDNQTGSPLKDVYVYIKQVHFNTTTDANGEFEFKDVPEGKFTLTIECLGYETKNIEFNTDNKHHISFKVYLNITSQRLRTLKVFGKLNYSSEASSRISEKNSNNVTDIISARAMERSPDINAANVLQRMSGITLQRNTSSDEAYAIIRGMEPRYNNTLVNGIKIASPDEKSRFVSVNVIPSDLLSRITVDKTLTPDMEGDAIGGSVNLILKNAPDSFSLKVEGSGGYSQFFLDDKYIYVPTKDIQPLSPLQRNPPGYVAQPGDFSRSNLDFRTKTPMPTGTAGVTFSDRFIKRKLGVIISDNVQNLYYGDSSQENAIAPENQFISNAIHSIEVDNNTESTHQLNNGLVTHIDYHLNDYNEFSVDNFYLYNYLAQARVSVDTTLIGTGRVGPGTGQVFLNDRSLTEKQHIENLKISGNHLLNSHLLVDWSGVLSEAGKKAPDRATLTNDFLINSDFSKTATYFNTADRIWQRNDDRDYAGLANINYRNEFDQIPYEVKAGGLFRYKKRYNLQDMYELRAPTENSSGGSAGSKPVFTNIYDVQWSVFNTAGSQTYDPNNYHAEERVAATYIQLSFELHKLAILGGARQEMTYQHFKTSKQSITAITEERINYTDILPSLHLKYRLTPKTNLRLSYYKSISRPNYYELVPYTIRGSDFIEQGNPYLKHAVAQNFDFRYELYPGGEQQLFAGVFYKIIQNPIELGLVSEGLSGGSLFYMPENYGTAHNYGAELAFIKYWGKLGVMGNYTYTHSAITSPKILYYKANHDPNLKQIDSLHVMETRSLQGQSNDIINLSLLYRDLKDHFFTQLSYQFVGKTLSEVSLYYNSDYYQQPMSTLDFSIEKALNKHFTIFGKFNNLLNTPTTIKAQRYLVVERTIYARSFHIGIRYIH